MGVYDTTVHFGPLHSLRATVRVPSPINHSSHPANAYALIAGKFLAQTQDRPALIDASRALLVPRSGHFALFQPTVRVTDDGQRIVTVKLLNQRAFVADAAPEEFVLPRISFTHELPSGHTLLRRQFPLAAAYCTTFHSCQGLTYDAIGIDLTVPVFTHGQLYTALFRVRSRERATVRVREGEATTRNVTYTELLLAGT
jgi:hypothetical protein